MQFDHLPVRVNSAMPCLLQPTWIENEAWLVQELSSIDTPGHPMRWRVTWRGASTLLGGSGTELSVNPQMSWAPTPRTILRHMPLEGGEALRRWTIKALEWRAEDARHVWLRPSTAGTLSAKRPAC